MISVKNKNNRLLSAYLLLIIALFTVMASRSNLQLGLRYLLPVYPFIFIISALGFKFLFYRQQVGKLIGAAFVLWLCLIHVFIWPDYLSYFNISVGGPENGYRNLRDSNLDWGQDLPALKDFMTRENINFVKLDYFGEGDPSLCGINFKTTNKSERGIPGEFVYAISVNRLDRYTWTGTEEPDARAGHSMLIYDFRRKKNNSLVNPSVIIKAKELYKSSS